MIKREVIKTINSTHFYKPLQELKDELNKIEDTNDLFVVITLDRDDYPVLTIEKHTKIDIYKSDLISIQRKLGLHE